MGAHKQLGLRRFPIADEGVEGSVCVCVRGDVTELGSTGHSMLRLKLKVDSSLLS